MHRGDLAIYTTLLESIPIQDAEAVYGKREGRRRGDGGERRRAYEPGRKEVNDTSTGSSSDKSAPRQSVGPYIVGGAFLCLLHSHGTRPNTDRRSRRSVWPGVPVQPIVPVRSFLLIRWRRLGYLSGGPGHRGSGGSVGRLIPPGPFASSVMIFRVVYRRVTQQRKSSSSSLEWMEQPVPEPPNRNVTRRTKAICLFESQGRATCTRPPTATPAHHRCCKDTHDISDALPIGSGHADPSLEKKRINT